jgi:hypothetical protein
MEIVKQADPSLPVSRVDIAYPLNAQDCAEYPKYAKPAYKLKYYSFHLKKYWKLNDYVKLIMEMLNSFEPAAELTLGDCVDYQCENMCWIGARIINEAPAHFKLTFPIWSNRQDEWVQKMSTRLGQFLAMYPREAAPLRNSVLSSSSIHQPNMLPF